jgi:HEAT repeat protein
MSQILIVFACLFLPPSSSRPDSSPPSLSVEESTFSAATEQAIDKLSLPCPERGHINECNLGDEDRHFGYRVYDMYDDCPDEIDLLARTKEPVDERLLALAGKGRELPERYRAAYILIQRRNTKIIPILEKMVASPSREERLLAWHAYTEAIRNAQLPVPTSFAAALAHCRDEQSQTIRAQIIYFLGACKAKEAIPLLTASLDNDFDYCAVSALGEIGDPATAPAILERAKKETLNPHVYFGVLGRLGTTDAVDYLIEHLHEGCFAVRGLFATGSPKALPALEKYLERLARQDKPDELDLATAQIAVLRLKEKDPRNQLLAWAEDPKQSHWMRTDALEVLSHYDWKSFADRVVRLYRTDPDDWIHLECIRLLRNLPGQEITDAMIEQALTENKNEYYFSHDELRLALSKRLGKSFRTMPALIEYLQCERSGKAK